jgi:hypothetical protein
VAEKAVMDILEQDMPAEVVAAEVDPMVVVVQYKQAEQVLPGKEMPAEVAVIQVVATVMVQAAVAVVQVQ